MKDFRFATFNMHHGRTKGSIYSPKKMLNAITDIDADILCVQEIDHRSARTFLADQLSRIAQHCDYEYRTVRVRFFGAGFQNIAIFSRFPIVTSSQHVLPSYPGHQPRKTLTAVIDCGSHIIDVTTMHLHAQKRNEGPNTAAGEQFEFALEQLSNERISLIGADLNMDREVLPIAQKFGYSAPSGLLTSPANNPSRQIDWILARGCSVHDAKVSKNLIGDHRALISTVTWL